MANTKKTNSMDTIDLADFFSRDNENNGVWMEPSIKGVPCGFEFKVCGVNSNIASKVDETWRKAQEEVSLIKDENERSEREDEIFANRIAGYVVDIRGKDGKKLVANGKEVTKDDIPAIIYNSPALAVEVSKFAARLENFLGKEKNA